MNNPLDEFFQTQVVKKEEVSDAPVLPPDTTPVDTRTNEIYEKALEAFKDQMELSSMVDPKYAARNAEVAAIYLKLALDAVNTAHKREVEKSKPAKGGTAGTINNTMIVADRNEILDKILGNKS